VKLAEPIDLERSKTATELADREPGAELIDASSTVFLLVRWPEGVDVTRLSEGQAVTFGRSNEASVIIPDSRVSRIHARIQLEHGVVSISDLGSRNGTRVNQKLLRQADRRVFGGDVIHIGPLELAVARIANASGDRAPKDGEPRDLVVADPAMRKLFEIAHRLAETQTTVLILGETGCGKDAVAESIHRWSTRRDAPLVRVNCHDVSDALLEALERAGRGTLFLDEIGELNAEMQAKLVAILENRRPGDVRLICATHRDLFDDVRVGQFREDLYYRINTFTLQIPPLRERPGEIVLLAHHYAREFATRMGLPEGQLATTATNALLSHSWPGNVRELKNAIEHAMVLAGEGRIELEHLPPALRQSGGSSPYSGKAQLMDGVETTQTSSELLEELAMVERKSIEEALRAERGNQTRAARRLGITRRALVYRMGKLGIKRAS
jgi:DNA-binding NtrC family response regulator